MKIWNYLKLTDIFDSVIKHMSDIEIRQPDTYYFIFSTDSVSVAYKLQAYSRTEAENILEDHGVYRRINRLDYLMVRYYHIKSKTGKILYNDKFEVGEIKIPEGSLLFTLEDL